MKKKDLFLGGGILFAACVLFLVMNLMQYVQEKESGQKENQEKQVVIKVDGEVYGRYSLDEDQEIDIKIDGKVTNVLVIRNHEADMTEADCPDQLCVHQKAISKDHETIVCLPNQVVAEVKNPKENNELDGIAN